MEFAFIGTHTAEKWEAWNGSNFDVSNETVRLAKERTPTYVSPRQVIADPPSAFTPVDIDIDGCGDLYVLTAEGEIYRYDHEKEALRRLPCLWYPEDETGNASEDGTRDPIALCVTEDSIYVADGAIDGVLAFSKHRYQMRWRASEPFEDPVALVGDARTGYVLDRGSDRGEGFIVTVRPTGVAEETVVTGLETPMGLPADVAMGSDGDLYVLDWQVRDGPDDRDESNDGGGDDLKPVVRRFSASDSDDHEFTELVGDEVWIPPEYDPRCIEAVTERQILVGVGPDTVGETTLHRYLPDPDLPERGRFERITSFKETCSTLLLQRRKTNGRGRGLYAISGTEGGTVDGETNEIYFLDEVRRNRLNTETGAYDAHAWRRLDSGTRGTEWHRVTMGLHLGEAGTQVRLRYYATDEEGPAEDLEEIDGIGPTYADRLRDADITGISELVVLDAEEIARIVSVEIVDISPERTAGWLAQARELLGEGEDLEEIDGIGPTYASRLRDAGVTRISELVELTSEEIAEIVSKEVLDVPPRQAERWLDRARKRIESEWTRRRTPASISNPRDALLDAAEGRYLWVRIELLGSESSSPGVDSFRAYFPRQSYLRYLPGTYQEDVESAEFLERFLSIFESTFVDIEEDIGSVTKYLDACGIPADYLSWLGRWLAIDTDETWPDPVKRKIIDRAPDLFKKRGTREGLLEMLVIYLGDSAALPAAWEATLERERERIEELVNRGELMKDEAAEEVERMTRSAYLLEYSDLDCIDVEAAKRPYVAQLGCPQCFLVLVPPFADDEQMRAVDRIVEAGTPAHAVGRAVRLRPWIQLGGESYPGNTYLGINSALSERDFVLEESTLGTDSLLGEREEFSQLDVRSRLGTDTVIS